jgi:ParB-like chromosome segregation protein Spo0J
MAATVKSQKLVDDERLDITKWKEFTPHPAMKLIPHMRESEFEELKADIAKNGMKEPILFTGTRLLDGLHRYVAWKELKKKERVPRVPFHGTDALREVLSRNIMRRHLSDDQRAFIVTEALRVQVEAEALKRKYHEDEKKGLRSKSTEALRTDDAIAEAAGVTPYKARQAVDVSKFGTSTEKADVHAGTARLKDTAWKARKRAAKAGKRKAKPKKEVDKMSEEYVVKKFNDFLNNNWGVSQHRAVKAIIRPLTEGKP